MSGPTVNIAGSLSRMADRYPDKPAVVWVAGLDSDGARRYEHVTFRQLDQLATRYAAGLRGIGIEKGMRAILMVRPGADFFALTFALLRLGAVPVLIDPGMGRKNLARCLADIDAEAFIGIPLAHVLRKLHPVAFRSVRIAVTVGRRWFWGGYNLNKLKASDAVTFEPAATRADDPAAILFTSGSTGPAKGVLYEHGMFDAQVRYLESHYGYGPDEVDLPTFPLFALFDAALGMTAVLPRMDFSRPASVDPREIIALLQDHRCTHMFGSPALLNRVGRYIVQEQIHLDSLKRIITCGAPIGPRLLSMLHKVLPVAAEIHTPYGATESLPVASIGSREILRETADQTATGAGTCVGRPMDGLDVRIIEITDEPIADWSQVRELPAGRIGEVVVKGPVVTRCYYKKAEATALAKIADGSSLWHRMGDVGYLDERGRLWFCGRKAHRVRTVDGPMYTVPCEAVFNQHPKVYRSALVGVGRPGEQVPVLCVEPDPEYRHADPQILIRELVALARQHEHTRAIRDFRVHPGFPVDVRHNAKINREQLAQWASEQGL